MQVPTIIIHRGYSAYLKWALKQAKLVCDKVILLGNDENEKMKQFIDYMPIAEIHDPLYQDFLNVYEHMSFNDHRFELICFERWFALLGFMKRESVDLVLHLDSDVMLFDDLDEIPHSFDLETLAAYHIPLQTYDQKRWIGVSHTSFWTRKGLQAFCEFIVETYTNNKTGLRNKWRWHLNSSRPGGISDMALLYLFYIKHEKNIVNLAPPVHFATGDDRILDLNISSSENFNQQEYVMARSGYLFRIKKLCTLNGQLSVQQVSTSKLLHVVSLHCQGKAKILMFHYFRGKKSMADRLEFTRFSVTFFRQRISQYIRFLSKKTLHKKT